jgi:hypothetical protein
MLPRPQARPPPQQHQSWVSILALPFDCALSTLTTLTLNCIWGVCSLWAGLLLRGLVPESGILSTSILTSSLLLPTLNGSWSKFRGTYEWRGLPKSVDSRQICGQDYWVHCYLQITILLARWYYHGKTTVLLSCWLQGLQVNWKCSGQKAGRAGTHWITHRDTHLLMHSWGTPFPHCHPPVVRSAWPWCHWHGADVHDMCPLLHEGPAPAVFMRDGSVWGARMASWKTY